jgi:hypothetical protein
VTSNRQVECQVPCPTCLIKHRTSLLSEMMSCLTACELSCCQQRNKSFVIADMRLAQTWVRTTSSVCSKSNGSERSDFGTAEDVAAAAAILAAAAAMTATTVVLAAAAMLTLNRGVGSNSSNNVGNRSNSNGNIGISSSYVGSSSNDND